MIAISCILVTSAFTYMSAIVDAQHLEKKQHIDNHSSRACLRLCFFSAIAIYNPVYGVASALLFYALFDQLLNWMRELPFWYLGTVSKIDRFFNEPKVVIPYWRCKGVTKKVTIFLGKSKWLYITVKIVCLSWSFYLFLN